MKNIEIVHNLFLLLIKIILNIYFFYIYIIYETHTRLTKKSKRVNHKGGGSAKDFIDEDYFNKQYKVKLEQLYKTVLGSTGDSEPLKTFLGNEKHRSSEQSKTDFRRKYLSEISFKIMKGCLNKLKKKPYDDLYDKINLNILELYDIANLSRNYYKESDRGNYGNYMPLIFSKRTLKILYGDTIISGINTALHTEKYGVSSSLVL